MRKLTLLSLCIPVLLLFSFVLNQNRGIKRVSKHLYTVSTTANKRVSVADKERLKDIIAKHYGIKEFGRGEITIGASNPLNKASGGIFDSSVYKDWVSTRFIFWKQISTLPDEAIKANEILAKYAD